MRSEFRVFAFASAVLFASVAAHADSIVLDSISGNTYTYGLDLDGPSTETFSAGQTITLTGLSGVTGASSLPFAASSTATSVTLTAQAGAFFQVFSTGTFEFTDVFTVTSNSGVSGMVNFAINGTPTASGTVEGPVAAVATTPEPGSLALLGTGLLGIVGAVRRRLSR